MTTFVALQCTALRFAAAASSAAETGLGFDTAGVLDAICRELDAVWDQLPQAAQSRLGDLLGTLEHAQVRQNLPDAALALRALRTEALALN